MRFIRHLPPPLRVVGILGFLCILASLVLSTAQVFHLHPFSLPTGVYSSRIQLVAMNLGLLGLAVIFTLNAYRMRHVNMRLPLATWQRQARTILFVAILPLVALTLALVIPPTLSIYGIAFGISVLAAVVTLVPSFVIIANG